MGKVIGGVIVVVLVLLGIAIFKAPVEEKNDIGVPFLFVGTGETPEIIYFYGEECPHCHDVMKFLEENKVAEKVNFEKKEVWHNVENSREMRKKAEICEKGKGEKCFIGTPDVTGFFKKAAGM